MLGPVIKLLVIDKSKWFGEAFHFCLPEFPRIVYLGWCQLGDHGLSACQELKPNIVLIDVSPNNREELQMIKAICRLDDSLKVIFFSMSCPGVFVPLLVKYGAASFISKYSSLQNIIKEIVRINDEGNKGHLF